MIALIEVPTAVALESSVVNGSSTSAFLVRTVSMTQHSTVIV
jgi:hypothetical protein